MCAKNVLKISRTYKNRKMFETKKTLNRNLRKGKMLFCSEKFSHLTEINTFFRWSFNETGFRIIYLIEKCFKRKKI
jgi:hypothetical protein